MPNQVAKGYSPPAPIPPPQAGPHRAFHQGHRAVAVKVNSVWKYVYFGCCSHHAINRRCFVGKRTVKRCTDKVRLTSAANYFSMKLSNSPWLTDTGNTLTCYSAFQPVNSQTFKHGQGIDLI